MTCKKLQSSEQWQWYPYNCITLRISKFAYLRNWLSFPLASSLLGKPFKMYMDRCWCSRSTPFLPFQEFPPNVSTPKLKNTTMQSLEALNSRAQIKYWNRFGACLKPTINLLLLKCIVFYRTWLRAHSIERKLDFSPEFLSILETNVYNILSNLETHCFSWVSIQVEI